ncbi:uncharacterized protein METZ01_LOCUS512987 [marine metagenome]|uniref:Uncharacterized protein n=1 Tax=marine metagenome TaxID=408172 RepID=A0A383EUP2_9ZZZZ
MEFVVGNIMEIVIVILLLVSFFLLLWSNGVLKNRMNINHQEVLGKIQALRNELNIYHDYFIAKEDPNDLTKHGLHEKQGIAKEQERLKDAQLEEISKDSFS